MTYTTSPALNLPAANRPRPQIKLLRIAAQEVVKTTPRQATRMTLVLDDFSDRIQKFWNQKSQWSTVYKKF
jgi:hypothetical protein